MWLVLVVSRNWKTKSHFSFNSKSSYDEWRAVRWPGNRSAIGQIWINFMTVVWSILSSSPPLCCGSCWSEIFGLARFLHHSTWLFVLQIKSTTKSIVSTIDIIERTVISFACQSYLSWKMLSLQNSLELCLIPWLCEDIR